MRLVIKVAPIKHNIVSNVHLNITLYLRDYLQKFGGDEKVIRESSLNIAFAGFLSLALNYSSFNKYLNKNCT
jgi:hypothetical protein